MHRHKLSIDRPTRALRERRRRLVLEGLETRSLLAADCYHNFMMPEDTDGSGDLSPLDALVVINRLNATTNSNNPSPRVSLWQMADVDADGTLSPLDALSVINALNESTMNGTSLPSQTDLNRRMAWIEKAISTGDLPWNYTMDDAYEALAALKRGGRPELGDRVIHGRLMRGGMQFQGTGDDASDDTSGSETGGGEDGSQGSDGGSGWDVPLEQPWLSRILNRLSALGASDALLDRVETALEPLVSSDGVPPSIDDVKGWIEDLLADEGIDLESIFPNHEAHDMEQWLAQLQDRLSAAGWSSEQIASWLQGWQDLLKLDATWSIEEVQQKLAELGFDWKSLLSGSFDDGGEFIVDGDDGDDIELWDPVEPDAGDSEEGGSSGDGASTGDDGLIAGWVERLSAGNVPPEIIDRFVSLLGSAFASGAIWTEKEFRDILTKLGVDVETLFPNTPVQPPMTDSSNTEFDEPPSNPPLSLGPELEFLGRTDMTRWLPALVRFGVPSETIQTVLQEIQSAQASGRPLTPAQIVMRLRQLGVSVDRWLRPMA